jgi:hypothetical protein
MNRQYVDIFSHIAGARRPGQSRHSRSWLALTVRCHSHKRRSSDLGTVVGMAVIAFSGIGTMLMHARTWVQ